MEKEEIITLYDEEEGEIPFRVVGRMEWKGGNYALLQDAEDGEAGIMVFQVTPGEDGTEDYDFVEDDELSDDVFYYWQAERDDYEFADAE